jgi:hypothetical protein
VISVTNGTEAADTEGVAPAAADGGGGASKGLAVAALIAGALGRITALVALAPGRRRLTA